MDVRQSTEFKVPVILTDSGSNAPVTGVVYSAVTVYIQKQGGAVTQKTLTAPDWSEVSAANMPGVYDLTLSASDTDTLGYLKFHLTVVGSNPYRGYLEVIAKSEAETFALMQRSLALNGANRVVDQEVLDSQKRVTSARIRTYDTPANAALAYQVGNPGTQGLIGTYSVTATYSLSGACRMLVTEVV